jgi:hypothetical protein
VEAHSDGRFGRSAGQVAWPASSLDGCAVDSSPCDVCRPDVYRSRKCEENRHKGSGARLHTHKDTNMHAVCQHLLFKNSAFVSCPYLVKYVDSFDILFKRFEEVLKTDITQRNSIIFSFLH